MKQVLYQRLLDIGSQDFVRFHYPGHKGRNLHFDPGKLPQIDQTEIIGTDDLQAPEEILLETQQMAADLFGTRASFFGVGGSTMANYAAIGASTKPQDTVLIQRNSHRSIYQGAMLQDLKILTISPDYDEEFSLLTGLSTETLEEMLRAHPEIKTAIFTNPSYYGLCLNLKEIVELCHSYDVTVMVDEAHGAHLIFTDDRELSALRCGADIVVHSAHKSLPAMTSTSILHVNSDRIPLERVRKFFNLYTTSSPSYVLMVSTEAALTEMEAHGYEKFKALYEMRVDAVSRLESVGAEVYSIHDHAHLGGYDRTKLFFKVPGYDGDELLHALHDRGVELELADARAVLAVLSTETTQQDFDRLIEAVGDLPEGSTPWHDSVYKDLKTNQLQTLRTAYYADYEWVSLDESEGRIVVDFLQLYPPGIPIIIPGEVMTAEILNLIQGNRIIGVMDGKVRVEK